MKMPDEHHGRDGPDPVEVARHHAVLGARGRHADHFLGAQVGREERQPGDPGGDRAAREEEVLAAPDVSPQDPADAEHEGEIDDQDRVVDRAELDLVHGRKQWRLNRAPASAVARRARELAGPELGAYDGLAVCSFVLCTT